MDLAHPIASAGIDPALDPVYQATSAPDPALDDLRCRHCGGSHVGMTGLQRSAGPPIELIITCVCTECQRQSEMRYRLVSVQAVKPITWSPPW